MQARGMGPNGGMREAKLGCKRGDFHAKERRNGYPGVNYRGNDATCALKRTVFMTKSAERRQRGSPMREPKPRTASPVGYYCPKPDRGGQRIQNFRA